MVEQNAVTPVWCDGPDNSSSKLAIVTFPGTGGMDCSQLNDFTLTCLPSGEACPVAPMMGRAPIDLVVELVEPVIRRTTEAGEFELDIVERVLRQAPNWPEGHPEVELSLVQTDLLRKLANNQGVPVPREELAEMIAPGQTAFIAPSNLRTNISRLRATVLKETAQTPVPTIRTRRLGGYSHGYQFAPAPML